MLVALGAGNENSEEPSDKAFLAAQTHPTSDGETPSLKPETLPSQSVGPLAQNMDMSSVITQVTRESSQPVQRPAPFRVEQPLQRPSWNTKLRSFLLCCFAPETNGYTRTRENEPHGHAARSGGSINRHHPPTAPKYNREAVIGPKHPDDTHKKTLVLDLDETLVHSSFKPIPNPDYIIPVEIDGKMVDGERLSNSLNSICCCQGMVFEQPVAYPSEHRFLGFQFPVYCQTQLHVSVMAVYFMESELRKETVMS